MSAYTTLSITRKKAIETVMAKLLGGITDEELKQFMNNELEPRLYNTRIVSDDAENDDEYV